LDLRIDRRVKTIFERIPTSKARSDFVRSERAWFRYRQGSCSAEASAFTGGSFEPVAFGRCIEAKNRQHLADLAELEGTLWQGGR
jgi:uncharacterized protein YecT (DUF1311 family)